MAKELTDEELNLRRKARRRLIGAIALTLAVVVILPMVLESQPKSSGQEIELRIPAQDNAGEFVPAVAISEVSVALPVSAVAAVSEPVAASAVSNVVEAAPNAAEPRTVVQAAPAQSAPAASSTRAGKVSGATYAAQVGAYSNANTAKQELAKLKDRGFKAYTEKAGNKIRVRVGPYEERAKAEKVAKMLEKHGLHPSIVTIK